MKNNKKVVAIVVAIVAICVGIYFAITGSQGNKTNTKNAEKTTVSTTVDYDKNFKDASLTRSEADSAIRQLNLSKLGLKGKWQEFSLLQDTVPATINKQSYFKFLIKKYTDKFEDKNIIKTLYVSYDGKTLYCFDGNIEKEVKIDVSKGKKIDISKNVQSVQKQTTTKK